MTSRISFVHSATDRVLVVSNPSAGAGTRREAIHDLVACVKRRGLVPEVVTDLKALDALVARYHPAGQLRAVVAAGGDGTIAEVINRTEPTVPVTVYPLGTANLLANYLRLSADPAVLAETLIAGAVTRLDAGRANGRVFLLMAGCGFDADVVGRLHRRRDGGHIRYWTYAQPILEAIRTYRYPPQRIVCELAQGDTIKTQTFTMRWAFVANLPCYAAGLQTAPDAVANDGLLDVCAFGNGSFWHGLRYIGYVALGRHRTLSDCQVAMATRVHIESDEPVPYQLDGDPGGMLPLDIDVLPDRMTLLAPLDRLLELNPRRTGQSLVGAE